MATELAVPRPLKISIVAAPARLIPARRIVELDPARTPRDEYANVDRIGKCCVGILAVVFYIQSTGPVSLRL